MGNRKSLPLEPTPQMVQMLSVTTKCSETDIWNSYERFKSYAPGGQMDKKTFIKRYQTKFPKADVKHIAEMVFKYFDADNSGKISFMEYFLPNAFIYQVDARERAEILFDIFDVDDDNVVSEKELRKMVEGLYEMRGEKLKKDQIKGMAAMLAKHMDCDGDKKIAQDEFIHALLTNPMMKEMLDFNYGNV